MFFMKKNKEGFLTLGGKLLVYILLASSAVTTVLTAGVFYFDYQEEKNNLDQIQTNLRTSAAVGLSDAVFTLDENAMRF